MKNHFKVIFKFFYVLLIIVSVSGQVAIASEGLTREQGDAILKELSEMRKLLERIEKKTPTRQVQRQVPKTAKIPVKGGSVIGSLKAPLTMIEFTDYECPYCLRFYENTYPELKKKYIDTGKLKLIIKDLPLKFHPHARKAAQATRCAGEQGKFIDLHLLLYKNRKKIQEKYLSEYAKAISIDVKRFNECLSSTRYLADIDRDTAEARKAGINGTPTFVIGKTTGDILDGIRIVGAQKINIFDQHIQKLLRIE